MTATRTPERLGVAAEDGTRRGSLLRPEVRRLLSRRFVRILILLSILGYLAAVIIASTQFAKSTPEALAQAEADRAAQMEQTEEFRQQCLDDPNLPPGGDPELICGPPASEQDFDISFFIQPPPFDLADNLPGGAIAITVATAALLFVIGATYIGAEWSTRSIVALLSWEPRRLRVMAVKTFVITAAAALLAVATQLVWTGTAFLLARWKGSSDVGDDFWGRLIAQQARGVLLVVAVALLGFGIAHLVRNTGAALGVGFVYFAVVESAVRIFWAKGQAFLVTDNAIALVNPGGYRINLFDESRSLADQPLELVLSNTRGGLTLAAYVLVLLAVGTWTFRKRDLH